MQTAIDWLIDQYKKYDGKFMSGVYEQAKEMEKEQLQKAFSDGQETPINHPTLPHYSREEYYKDNYNQKELIIVDFDKVKEEWIEEANGMTDLEKAKYYLKKINQNK